MNVDRTSRERRSFPVQPSTARAARTFVGEHLTAHGAAASVVDDFMLAISELVSNSVVHTDDAAVVVVIDTTDLQWWQIEVAGHTPLPPVLRDPEEWAVASAAAPSGRGLGIIRRVMDEVAVHESGCIVMLRRRRAKS